MNTEANELRHSGELGAPSAKRGLADLLFAAVVIVITGAWIALVALRFYLKS
jgi:hypothetical protein